MGQECSSCKHCSSDREIHELTPRVQEEELLDLKSPVAVKAQKKNVQAVSPNLRPCADDAGQPCTFTLQLHGAHIMRSVARFGWMDPYAVIAIDGNEVGRTAPKRWAHKDPKWESSFSWSFGAIPGSIKISVWDKNRFHLDKLCGSVTIPLGVDMGQLERKEFLITKKETTRGFVILTLSVLVDKPGALEHPTTPMSQKSLGMEMDHVVSWSQGSERLGASSPQIRLVEDGRRQSICNASIERSPSKVLAFDDRKSASALLGSWKCIATRDLDEFLKATGVSIFQRKIAKAAKWPSWEFSTGDGVVLFINHSAIGDLKEEFPLGKEYKWTDGQGNPMTCRAEWKAMEGGGVLLTSRSGSIGSYKEERKVVGDILEFTLTHGTGASWGRTFRRSS